MKTNVGKQFLRIVDESFQERHELRQIFNRHTLNKTPPSNTHGQNAEKTDKNSSEWETATCKSQIAVIGKNQKKNQKTKNKQKTNKKTNKQENKTKNKKTKQNKQKQVVHITLKQCQKKKWEKLS